MSTYSHLFDRLKLTSVSRACGASGASIASFLSADTAQEHERRRAHLVALLLVALVATAKQFNVLTDSAPFSVYVLAIAVSAFLGGFAPACVATLAAVLLANGGPAAVGPSSRIMFVLESLAVAGLVSELTHRLRERDASLVATQAAYERLRAAAAAQDLSGRQETEAFRDAALRAQVELQKVADEAQGQVAALESLADPLVNPIAGLATLDELLERLRSTMRADGVAVVQLGQAGTRVISEAGLRGQVRVSGMAVGHGASDGRVAIVHNDAAHVAQVSALTWPPTVSSIMVVPVGDTGTADVRIEVVTERRASATEWDLALARIVADRLRAIAFQIPADSSNPVPEDGHVVVS